METTHDKEEAIPYTYPSDLLLQCSKRISWMEKELEAGNSGMPPHLEKEAERKKLIEEESLIKEDEARAIKESLKEAVETKILATGEMRVYGERYEYTVRKIFRNPEGHAYTVSVCDKQHDFNEMESLPIHTLDGAISLIRIYQDNE